MVFDDTLEAQQRAVCTQHQAEFVAVNDELKVGIALNVREGILPLNGLRHPPEGDTTGWYIWAGGGDPPNDPEFFKPLHVAHLETWCPRIRKYLGLGPGWRFLVTDDYEDIWFDPNLLDVGSKQNPNSTEK